MVQTRGASWSAGTGNPRAGVVWRTPAVSFTPSIKGAAPPRVVVVVPRKTPPAATVLPTEVLQLQLQLEVRQRALRDGHAGAAAARAEQLQQQQRLLQRWVQLLTKPTVMAGRVVEATMVQVPLQPHHRLQREHQHLHQCLRLQPWRQDCSHTRRYHNQRPLQPLAVAVLVAMRVVEFQVLDAVEEPPLAASNQLSNFMAW
mmetsp:Transcript_112607/g.218196  ORF Transcript_112607/g.218196 Transcript_112607/m.218196 type:complete len:201 (+) Transcript_112607:1125-1727(+)